MSDVLVERLRQYALGAEMILSNAEALCAEAVALRGAGFLPRAAFLHQISMEECAKIDMLGAWAVSWLLSGEVDEEAIARSFRDHKAKNHANAYNICPTPEESAARASGNWDSASLVFRNFQRDFHIQANRVKNSALYVDFKGGIFESPKNLIGEEIVAALSALNGDFLSQSALFVRLLTRMANEPDFFREWARQFERRAFELSADKADPREVVQQLFEEMGKLYR